jgi:hypothetical protein
MRPAEVVLAVIAVVAGVVSVRYGLRYGDGYSIGEDTYRRDRAADVLRFLVPGAVAA